MEQIKKGDIVQIIEELDKWYPCLLIVSEVKTWGIQGYITIPGDDGGNAFYRIPNDHFEKVGSAVIEVK